MGTLNARQLWLVGGGLAAVLLVAIVVSLVASGGAGPETPLADIATPEPTAGPSAASLVYATIAPSLVVIEAEGSTAADDTLGLGTGVIVNDDGSILTAAHVVQGAESIDVLFADGTLSTAIVVSTELENDMATLQAAQYPDVLVPAVIASSQSLRIGDAAYVVGHPLGLVGSMSAGVVSGFDRSIPVADDVKLQHLIQVDAAVNPGNSGGPLLNLQGQVVGIVTALATVEDQPGFQGIAFAVPITAALDGSGLGPAQ